jgi:shikimate kinase
MGLPYEAGFSQREAMYCACEMEVLREVVAHASACAATHTPCVIDTSGSVIYADPALLQQLRQCSIVLYLRIPVSLHQEMLNTYLEHPRPVIWHGLFQQAPNESRDAAFRRCYAQLISYRERLYEEYSDVVLDYDNYRQPTLTVEHFLAHIRAAAEQNGVADRLSQGDLGVQMQ